MYEGILTDNETRRMILTEYYAYYSYKYKGLPYIREELFNQSEHEIICDDNSNCCAMSGTLYDSIYEVIVGQKDNSIERCKLAKISWETPLRINARNVLPKRREAYLNLKSLNNLYDHGISSREKLNIIMILVGAIFTPQFKLDKNSFDSLVNVFSIITIGDKKRVDEDYVAKEFLNKFDGDCCSTLIGGSIVGQIIYQTVRLYCDEDYVQKYKIGVTPFIDNINELIGSCKGSILNKESYTLNVHQRL